MSDEQKKDVPQGAAPEPPKEEPAAGEAIAKPAEADGAPAAEAKAPAQQESSGASADATEAAKATLTDEEKEAKRKAAAEARAARAQQAEGGEPSDPPDAERAVVPDEEKEAKAKAAAEARAARANARARKTEGEEDGAPKQPSPNQPRLDHWVQTLKQLLDDAVVEEAFINEKDGHLPYVVLKNELWPSAAEQLRDHSDFKLNYLRNVSGIDQETHMEVAYHLLSLETKQELCVKIKTNRDTPSVPSATGIWPTANWNEREIYDLLGIDFPGHPDMKRILMSDDWVGHPLRKDYEPLDPEV